MSALAPTLERFFTQRLLSERRVSPNTVAAYRDTFRLLLAFVAETTGTAPSQLDLADLDADLIATFLAHLEHERGNSVRTRNARLAAIRSMFRFAAMRHPEHAQLIQRILAIPAKRTERTEVSFLTPGEVDALLAAPDRTTRLGRRDHAWLVLTAQTGLRVSETLGLRIADVCLDSGAHVRCHGKGRKERVTPLTVLTAAVLRVWLRERGGEAHEPLFPSLHGRRLSRDAVERIVSKHTRVAARKCPSLNGKRVTPHVLRHYIECMTMSGNQATGTILIDEDSFVGEHPEPITRHSLGRAIGY